MNRTNAIMSVLRAPHISEKSARLQEINQYVFEVAPERDQGRCQSGCRAAVQCRSRSGERGQHRRQGPAFRFRSGTRGNKRKAYVRLAEGHTIDVSAKA